MAANAPDMRLECLLLVFACLASSAAARPSYSKWLLRTADFQQKADPAHETWNRGTTPFFGTKWYEYKYERNPIFFQCHLDVESSEEDAHNGFIGGEFGRSFMSPPQGWVKQDLSKQIKVGDESRCEYYSGKAGEMWILTYRQGKTGGMLVFTGIHVEKGAFRNLVTRWTQSARFANPTFSVKPVKR
ncbi:hypothetical protein ABS71_08175 [bacterium SCN 62-11]|nr:MAG: hypothetical protein ABS71_08175 [bacterium SCN 62-11]